ncbi:hypothetical protein JYQ62_21390 [Nostoc sp. UHCC 0702]|nr:hypothetical protein JYQ62_21390 [Nostoc sp. UHCC 0702]
MSEAILSQLGECQRQYQDAVKAQALKNFIDWTLTEGQKSSLELGYLPLSKKVVDQVQSAANKIAE